MNAGMATGSDGTTAPASAATSCQRAAPPGGAKGPDRLRLPAARAFYPWV